MSLRRAGVCLALALVGSGCRNLGQAGVGGADSAGDGLVAHWTFDEGSGSVARDVTGKGHDAALKNVEWVPSPRGYALRFDGKDDLAQYGQVESMLLSGDLTLAVWVKTDAAAAPNTHRLIFGDAGYAVMRNANLAVDSYNRLSFEWGDGKAAAALLAPGSLLNGSWRQVVAVADSQARQVALYVDGAVVAEMPMPMPISKTAAKERLTGWFYNGFFQGDLDDIRLYARALSAREVQQLFRSQADVTIGTGAVLYDGTGPQSQGIAAVQIRNLSQARRRIELSAPDTATREITLEPGAQTEMALGAVPLQPVWGGRTDLFTCASPTAAGRVTVTSQCGAVADRQSVPVTSQSVVEPLQVVVHDPWQAEMPPGKTARVAMDLKLALPAEALREGTLRVRLLSRETGQEALLRRVASPAPAMPLALDVRKLPWGAYDLQVSFLDRNGREVVSTKRLATILPGGPQRIRVLNNLVSELLDARARGLLASGRLEFMNPRRGWVWFRAAGACTLRLGNDRVLAAEAGRPAVEAMRLLPAGKQVVEISGTPTDLLVRAIPALVYNVYPSTPRIAPFGSNTWERLSRHMLPNTNMIESAVVDTPEYREWLAQGKLWLANVQAPGLLDQKEWTVEQLLALWLNPGKPTAHAARPGLDLSKLSGMQVDEYYAGAKSTRFMGALTRSLAALSEHPDSVGKLWVPFLAGKFGATPDNLFMKTLLGTGWPFAEEVYVGEMPTEAENRDGIRSSFRSVAAAYESAYPGSLRRMIFTPMYAYLPYCTANRSPRADFRVHLDLQMQVLATDPAFFGLWGVQPYRSNYVDEEILNCMGRLLRHYGIEGSTEKMLSDPYELTQVADPDFEAGLTHWQVAPAEAGGVSADTLAGYGDLQGRYPGGAMGDTFAVMQRSAKAPNSLSQPLRGLEKGRLYSLKLITADYVDLRAGKTRKDPQTVSIQVDGAEVLEGGFSCPFPCSRGPKPFTAEAPFWMTYHWLQFRARGPTASLSLSDWAKPGDPGGPVGQQVMVNFVEVQPVLEE